MLSWFSVVLGGAWLVAAIGAAPPADAPLDPQLEPFRPFLGTTWRGEFANSTPEKPVVDVVRYERALNGKAIRSLHSINGGDYGGETLIWWDAERKALAFFYLTTAGFRTEGTMTASPGKFSSTERVTGAAGGVTEVRGTAEVRADGTMLVVAEYLRDGKWEPGRTTVYRRAPDATVEFR